MYAHVAASALSPRLLHGLLDDADPHLRISGTAVVCDISGFTTLSEQLAAAGREGTEQLIGTLSRIFTVLLPSTDDGGDVIKFAGDALFVLFSGDQHARHAAHAAWNMNRVLNTIGDIHLPLARTKLRMSTGVHTGTFEVFLTGTDRVSAVLTGADTSRVLELQSAAEAGRILVSDETAAALPANQVAPGEAAPGARRLQKAGSVAAAGLMALSVGRSQAAERFLPRAFGDRPDLLDAEPDHRWAAMGFVQVDAVPARPDEDDIAAMNRLTKLVEDVCAETGATLLDVDPAVGGYRYFLTAGAPSTTEDPEGRLISAALRIVALSSDFSLRAGIASGRVFAGFVGAMYRQTYTVMGDATNLAARLTSRAEPGTVLATRAALARTAVAFSADDSDEITVKGKSEAIPVATVRAPVDGQEPPATTVPFQGRADELQQLRCAITAAHHGAGSAVTITAPAGAGKSRLIREAVSACDIPVLRTGGDHFAARTAYRTVQRLLRPLLGIPPEADPTAAGVRLTVVVTDRARTLLPWLPLLAPAVAADVEPTAAVDALDDSFRAQRAHHALRELVAAIMPSPACIVVDDAQWVDAASAAALASVLADDPNRTVLLARREGDSALTLPGVALTLSGLTDDEARDMVEAVAGRALLPGDLDPLVARGEGNPLYLKELAEGFCAGSETLGIEQLVGERIDALAEPERAAVRRAAVLGWSIPSGLFIRCVGPAELAQTGGIAGFLELLEDTVRFRSELFHDVAYQQLNFQTRREVHQLVAAALLADPALGGAATDTMLAFHLDAAGDWSGARDAAERAGHSAENEHAMEDAVRAYRTAVGAARQLRPAPTDLAELWQSLGRVTVASGRATEGLEAYSTARGLTKDPVARAGLDREIAYTLNILGRTDDAAAALKSARRAARAAGDAGKRVLAAIAVTEAGVHLRHSDWSPARVRSQEAIVLLEGDQLDAASQRVLADAYRYCDIAASELEGDSAMVHLQRALDLYDELGDALSKSKVLSLIGVRAYYRGAWATAAGLYAQVESEAERAGDVVAAAIGTANLAEIFIDQGRLADAQPLLKRAGRVFAGSGNGYLIAFLDGFRGRAALRAGLAEAAREAFTRAADAFDALHEIDSLVDVRVRRVEASIALDDIDGAQAEFEVLVAREDLHGTSRSRLLCVAARLAARRGDLEQAIAQARTAADLAGPALFERALALAWVARWSRPDAALLRAEAETILGELGVVDTPTLLGPVTATGLPIPTLEESVEKTP